MSCHSRPSLSLRLCLCQMDHCSGEASSHVMRIRKQPVEGPHGAERRPSANRLQGVEAFGNKNMSELGRRFYSLSSLKWLQPLLQLWQHPLERPWASHCGHGESPIAKPVTIFQCLPCLTSWLWDNVEWICDCVYTHRMEFSKKGHSSKVSHKC